MARTKKTAGAAASLWKVWERTLHRIGDKILVVEAGEGREWTAAQLHQAALARLPQLAACRRGERIAFRLPNGADWFALFLAIQAAGLAAMPLDAGLPGEACLETARRLGASALFLDGAWHRFHRKGARRFRPGICCVKLTSGTTGLPKTIECRPSHLLADGANIVRTMGLRADDRNLAAVPLGHSYGLGNVVLPLILRGIPAVCAANYVPRQLVDWIGLHGVTVVPAVPALFRILAALPEGTSLGPLRLAISAGAPLAPEVARAFRERFGLPIHNFYGSSETGGICYDRTGSASLDGRSVGRPLRGVVVTLSARGRIEVSGPAVAVPRGRHRLPDQGGWNGRKELVLLGRTGGGANIGGKKVHPSEIERLLRSLPAVSDAAVWTVHEGGRDLLAAAVETSLGRAELERSLAAQLPEWKLPKRYLLARELPRTPRGKLDLPALRRRL